MLVAHKDDEVDILKEEIEESLQSALRSIKLKDKGVYVQASTLGSLEALLLFLKTQKIPVIYFDFRVSVLVVGISIA